MAEIIKYSEKAVAIYGSQSKYKEQFKKLGTFMRANNYRKAVWVFPNYRKEEVIKIITT